MEEKKTQKKIFNSRPIFYSFLALMLAVCTSRYLFVANVKYIVFVSIILVSFLIYCVIFKRWKTLAVVMTVFVFGLGWFFVGQAGYVGKTYNEKVQVVGRISDDYIDYGSRAEMVLKDVSINGEKGKNIHLHVYFEEDSEVQIGDIISYEGLLENNHLFVLGSFNLTGYREKTPYLSYVNVGDVSVLGNKLTADEQVRMKVKETLYGSIGEENGSVAYAVLFGDKNDVDSDVKNDYQSSGIIHLLTVSGLHITFLISMIGFFLNKLKVRRWINFLICFAFFGVYAWLCGWTPSVLRAGIMGFVLLFTKITGRCYDNLNSLGLAGIIITLFFPLSPLDNGFLMSFFCVGGIFIVSPWLGKYLRKIFPRFVADSFAISIASQIMILPFMAEFFSKVNFLSFFVNLIVVPFFGILYPFLFVSTILTLVMPFCGFLLNLCGFGFSFIAKTAEFFATTKLTFTAEPFDVFVCLFMFVFLFFMAKYFMASKRIKAVCCSSVLALCGIFAGISVVPPTPQTSISFCNNNYGKTFILITTKDGETAIVDPLFYQQVYRLMHNKGLKVVDVCFENSVSGGFAFGGAFDIENTISLVEYDSDEAILATKNEVGVVRGFSYQYIAYGGELAGLEIGFDGYNAFFVYEDFSAVSVEKFKEKHYDFVFVAEFGGLVPYFDCDYSYGLYKHAGLSYNYNENGNMACEIRDGKFVWRCLD